MQRRMRCVGRVALGGKSFIKGFVGNPVGKRLLGRPWNRWKEKIEIYF